MKYKNKFTEIHVFTRNGEYVGNILFDENIGVPMMSEEQFEDLILEHFPQLEGKGRKATFHKRRNL